jgi:hypothetical protein
VCVKRTPLTAEQVADLRQALPQCTVDASSFATATSFGPLP